MRIHFICRGNTFRSLLAAAYLSSLKLPDLYVSSSGTIAEKNRVNNQASLLRSNKLLKKHNLDRFGKEKPTQLTEEQIAQADLVVVMNHVVADEIKNMSIVLKKKVQWDVPDIDEVANPASTEEEKEAFWEETYDNLIKHVDQLVATHINTS